MSAKESPEEENTILDAQTKDKTVTNVAVNIIMDVTMAITTSTNAGISTSASAPPIQTAIQSGTPTPCKVIETNSSAVHDDQSKAQPSGTPFKKQDAQPNEVIPQGSSSKDDQVEKTLDDQEETTTEIRDGSTVDKDLMYSSSEDTLDENQLMEETLQRKSTRNAKPTMKAREMQRSANKGRRGKGRRGRGHR